MKPGTYSMRVNANFGRDAVRDITARVYMNENVAITQWILFMLLLRLKIYIKDLNIINMCG